MTRPQGARRRGWEGRARACIADGSDGGDGCSGGRVSDKTPGGAESASEEARVWVREIRAQRLYKVHARDAADVMDALVKEIDALRASLARLQDPGSAVVRARV